MLKPLLFLGPALLGLAAAARASDAGSGLVGPLSSQTNGIVIFQHSGVRTGLPACHTAGGDQWSFDGRTPEGQGKLALLTTALALRKTVRVGGKSICGVWPDVEEVGSIVVSP